MSLISAQTIKLLGCVPLSPSSSFNVPSGHFSSLPLRKHCAPTPLDSIVFSQKLATNGDRHGSFGARLVAKASATSAYGADIGEILGDVGIFTAAGEPVMFKDLWDQKQGMAVVALLRHFGCFCCWELASTLKESKAKFESSGVKLIAVGIGTPNKARILAERLPFPMDCLYADPDRKAYDILDLYYGLGRTFFNPASAKMFSRFKAVQNATKNYTIGATPDDKSSVLQQMKEPATMLC